MRRYMCAVAVLMMGLQVAQAQIPIPVLNASFEDPTLPVGEITTWQNPGATPEWTITGVPNNEAGFLHMTTTTSPYGFIDAQLAADGNNVLWMHDGQATQTLADTLIAGEYTLGVLVSHRMESGNPPGFGPNPYDIDLLVNGSPLTADSKVLPTTDGTIWQLATATYTILDGDPLIGGTLGVRLSSGGVQQLYDSVSLTYIPEPTSLALLGLAGLAMLRRRR